MTPSEVWAANGQDLHLLSIEGRGICGLTALITLREVLRQYQYSQKLPRLPRPCDVFDLAGGTGTGGIIAIMLFRLRMTVDEAITAYKTFSEDVFSKKSIWSHKKTNASRLENSIATLVHTSLSIGNSRAQNVRMLDDDGPKCFVVASTAKNLSSPTLFRTYLPPRNPSHNCTIVEAIRATTAEHPFFSSIDIGDTNLKETFINVGSRINNVVKAVLEEAVSIFPGRCISCVLSIGTGSQGITGFETTSTTELTRILKKVMNDGERISDEVAKELSDRDVFYCRLNVDHGLGDIGFEDWERLGDVKTHTGKYLEKYDVVQKVALLVQVLNRRTVIASTIEETLSVLSHYLDGLISIFPGECWTTVVSEFIRTVKPSRAGTETLNIQCALLRDTLESCRQGRDFMELPKELKGNIRQLLEDLKTTFQDPPTPQDAMTHVNTNIRKLLQRFWFRNHMAGNIAVHDILKYIQKDDTMKSAFTRLEQHAINQNLRNLNVAPSAAYDSFEVSEKVSCFKGTRVKLLNEIASWIASKDRSIAPIYVLDGVAGIGKSTIAKTVAEHAAGINTLGASFFFSRNDDERKTAKTFFPTIAYQLAYYNEDFADKINRALLRTPHVVRQALVKQFSTLITEPLQPGFVAGNPILIVIDALDECDRDGDTLLKIFADSIKNMPRLKLFITTRPEYHIRNVLDRYRHLKRFQLQDIEKSVVQSDIRLYLNFHLSENQVRDRFPGFRFAWTPDEKNMDVLIETCGTLFIIASTAVKFILDDKQLDPGKQLSWLLKGVPHRKISGSDHTTVMDSFYTQILLSAVPDNNYDDWFTRYQIVVGTIVALQHPLPCVALSALLDFGPDDIIRALSHLYSLVAPTGQDITFRIHHKSFPDFVSSSSRCEQRFLINLTARHLELGKQCLKIMDSQLKPNICNLSPTDRFKDNANVKHLTQDCVSQELAYASTHWTTHLINASTLDGEAEQLLECFASKQFLVWLEVLSIIGQVEIAYPSLDRVGNLLVSKSTVIREILHDCCRFIALNIEIIKVSAGHVYSAFAFVPRDTRLSRTYGGPKGIKLEVVSGHETKWNPTISIMTADESGVNCVTFSGDGTRLASASNTSVRLWDGQTGAEVAVMRGHSIWIKSIMFSPDGTKVASASSDTMVRLWDGETGVEIAVLQGHSRSVNLVAFSPDGSKLASASDDKTVRLWDGQTGAEIAVFRMHSSSVNSVVFSPHGSKVASASDDKTVRLWDGQTGEIAVLRGHRSSVNSVLFSPDGSKVASASHDVRLWDGQTGSEISVLQGHSRSVNSVVFSPDGSKLASASDDRTVRLWDGETGAEIAVLRGHLGCVNSVVFPPDGLKLASASSDKTVRLWDGQTGAKIAVFSGHVEKVNSVVFSPDGSKLASASSDATLRLWDGQTGLKMAVPREYLGSVSLVALSPDGTRLSLVFHDGRAELWDGAKIVFLRGHSSWIRSVVFSPDGSKLASNDTTVRLWDGRSGAKITVLRGHLSSVNSVVFSPDGSKLASASDDKTVRLWDGETGAEIAVLRGHSGSVNLVAFSPDGTRVASASADDSTVRLWVGRTCTQSCIFFGPQFVTLLDNSRLLMINAEELYWIDFSIGDTPMPLEMFMDSVLLQAAKVPDSNLWVLLVRRNQPLSWGLFVATLDRNGDLRSTSLCWFPPDLPVISLSVSSTSRIAVGCNDGQVLLLDTDFSSLL